jgi:hypothetical protein
MQRPPSAEPLALSRSVPAIDDHQHLHRLRSGEGWPFSYWDTPQQPVRSSKQLEKGWSGSRMRVMGKHIRKSDDTILEVRPVGDYDNVHYVRVGTLRNKLAE